MPRAQEHWKDSGACKKSAKDRVWHLHRQLSEISRHQQRQPFNLSSAERHRASAEGQEHHPTLSARPRQIFLSKLHAFCISRHRTPSRHLLFLGVFSALRKWIQRGKPEHRIYQLHRLREPPSVVKPYKNLSDDLAQSLWISEDKRLPEDLSVELPAQAESRLHFLHETTVHEDAIKRAAFALVRWSF